MLLYFVSTKTTSDWCQLNALHASRSQQTHHAIMTSLLRQNDVILKMTSFWRYNDVTITSCVQWGATACRYNALWSIPIGSQSCTCMSSSIHDDVIKWKHFPRYWPFVRGIHRSPVNSPHKGQWRGALMFSLICVWINAWVNNREAGDLRRYHTPLWRHRNDLISSAMMRFCHRVFATKGHLKLRVAGISCTLKHTLNLLWGMGK